MHLNRVATMLIVSSCLLLVNGAYTLWLSHQLVTARRAHAAEAEQWRQRAESDSRDIELLQFRVRNLAMTIHRLLKKLDGFPDPGPFIIPPNPEDQT